MSKPLKVAFVADEKDLARALNSTKTDLDQVGDAAKDASRKVDAAFSTTAEAADGVASASSQAAGGIGDIGGALAATGFISEGTAESMDTAAAAIMGMTGAADLLNLATEKIPGLQKVAAGATRGLAAAKRALGVAVRFALGPVGLIILAITAATAAVIYLWKNNETFRRVVTKVWEAAKKAIGNAVEWLREKVPPIFERIWKVIRNVPIVWVIRNFDKIIDFVKGLPGRISRAVSGMWDGIKDSFRGALNWIIDKWNGLSFDLPSFTAFGVTVGGGTISTPDIPRLATGGIITRPTTIVAGEKGREAIIPLDGRHDFGGGSITVNVNVGVGDPVAVGRELQRVLDVYRRHGGRGLAYGGA